MLQCRLSAQIQKNNTVNVETYISIDVKMNIIPISAKYNTAANYKLL